MKRILFHSNQLGIRGTEVAMYDYAKYATEFFGYECGVIFNKNHRWNDRVAVDKFSKLFPVMSYDTLDDLQKNIDSFSPDLFYAIKSGEKDPIVSKSCKTGVHVVFQHYQPHGDIYAYVAEWVAKKHSGGRCDFVPHMFDMPAPNETSEQFRKKYNIPKSAIVFGRHGGSDEFNIQFAHRAIKNAVAKNSNIYFVLVNTNKFLNHPQVIHIPKIVDMQEKSNFINACDAMIHARVMGEIFSCSIGEFCYHGKPVISAPFASHDLGHVEFLGDKGIWYNDESQLFDILTEFNPQNYNPSDYKMLSDRYTPKLVMDKFKKVFCS